MQKAKQAVSSFLDKDGKHDTTVHESVNPAVTEEHVTPTRHENTTEAIDREVHQHHYHTSVQPIQDREVLPEKHSHNLAETQHREIHHGGGLDAIKPKLEQEAAQFKDKREVGTTEHTSAAAPTVTGEHVHHHVHENIQPVIQKETIQPSVVHSTIPVHEVHHNEPRHHNASALPAMTMDEFTSKGGSLTGRGERTDMFKGEPKGLHSTHGHGDNSSSGVTGTGAGHHTSHHHNDGLSGSNTTNNNAYERGGENIARREGATGTTGTTGTTGNDGLVDSNTSRTHGTSDTLGNNSSGYTGSNKTSDGMTGTEKKPSLISKLNPMTDSNGDGQKGFMK